MWNDIAWYVRFLIMNIKIIDEKVYFCLKKIFIIACFKRTLFIKSDFALM